MNIFKEMMDKVKDLFMKRESTECLLRDDQQHVMSKEEMLDETIEGSFPASDPPGHISKSSEDKNLH